MINKRSYSYNTISLQDMIIEALVVRYLGTFESQGDTVDPMDRTDPVDDADRDRSARMNG